MKNPLNTTKNTRFADFILTRERSDSSQTPKLLVKSGNPTPTPPKKKNNNSQETGQNHQTPHPKIVNMTENPVHKSYKSTKIAEKIS
ncbi:hypothetical protein SAMN02910447_02192 [Ruminococcus sp. YE71]|nr:hypothetical protein SAMN02910446_02060 [Ruminococcus sp. YE78]SFW38490.1 hypothetical protein SAMN02910447_02192 [Ruminococcus sp. YE71]